jgi:putative endonuclease
VYAAISVNPLSLNLFYQTMQIWYLYMIKCRDKSLYTGIALDIKRRFREHSEQGKRCARYLRGKAPLKLVFKMKIGTWSKALRIEYRIKRLSKSRKELLVSHTINIKDYIQ